MKKSKKKADVFLFVPMCECTFLIYRISQRNDWFTVASSAARYTFWPSVDETRSAVACLKMLTAAIRCVSLCVCVCSLWLLTNTLRRHTLLNQKVAERQKRIWLFLIYRQTTKEKNGQQQHGNVVLWNTTNSPQMRTKVAHITFMPATHITISPFILC